jgi:hypothetical protein
MLAHSEKDVRMPELARKSETTFVMTKEITMPGFDEWIQKETLLSERRTKDAIFSDVLVIQN